jgi:hypothetical protein
MCSGTLQKRYRRQSTGAWEWDAARAVIAGCEAANAWDAALPPPPVPAPPEKTHRTTIAGASQAFLERIRSKSFEPATESKYRTFIKQLLAFTDSRGYVCQLPLS